VTLTGVEQFACACFAPLALFRGYSSYKAAAGKAGPVFSTLAWKTRIIAAVSKPQILPLFSR
jgi:hypothetical protein